MSISRCDCAGIRLLLGLVLVVTTWVSLSQQPPTLPEVPLADKWAHLFTYVLLAFLVDASWPDRPFDLTKWAMLLAYGLSIELIQSQIPNRIFSLADLLANATGILIYAVLIVRGLRAIGMR